jgi:adenylate kinase
VRVAVTGTPGTGKTTAVERVDSDLPVVHLNDVVRDEGLYDERDPDRDSAVADLDALRDHVPADALVESHLAHYLDADRVVVLRCHPDTLRERLRGRGESEESAAENAEAERLDIVLAAAVERHGADSVYEVETTDRSPAETAAAVEAVLAGDRDPSAGEVSYL